MKYLEKIQIIRIYLEKDNIYKLVDEVLIKI